MQVGLPYFTNNFVPPKNSLKSCKHTIVWWPTIDRLTLKKVVFSLNNDNVMMKPQGVLHRESHSVVL